MNIAFLHYHLNTGGVTTVIRQQANAIKNDCEVLAISGELPPTPFPVPTVHIPELAYDQAKPKKVSSRDIATSVLNALLKKWPCGCDVLHVHNPTLAKNSQLINALEILQKKGIRLLLQIHDFAEDGRPLSYSHLPYPADCHYAVINGRDYCILKKSGLKAKGLHHIPTAIEPIPWEPQARTTDKRVLYPVRAIRRKNIGEAILLSLFFTHKEKLCISMPPNSPIDMMAYLDWKRFVRTNRLNIEFDTGVTLTYRAQIASSSFVLTTSINEGFGFSFLEPWTAGKLLWGRKISDICEDFEQNHILLNHLYEQIQVPLLWIGRERFYQKWTASLLRAYAIFKVPLHSAQIERLFEQITENDQVDFGLLDEMFQQEIIFRLYTKKPACMQLIDINPFLSNPGQVVNCSRLIDTNNQTIRNCYSKTASKKRLMGIYSHVATRPITQCIDKKSLLNAFLSQSRFRLLKWGDFNG